MCTPYDKLESLDKADHYLKPGVTFEQLDALAYAVSDLSAAKRVNAARDALLADLDPYAALGAPTPGKHAA